MVVTPAALNAVVPRMNGLVTFDTLMAPTMHLPTVAAGKAHVDAAHPGRHTLVLGDSRATLPAFAREHGRVFDCVFVDGDHGAEGAWADLRNTASVAKPGALVIMDDMQYVGPQQAWARALAEGWVRETGGTDHGTRMRWGVLS